MPNTTHADLIISAQAAANEAISLKDYLEIQTIKLEKFQSAGFAGADFPAWENAFNAQLELLQHFGKQDSPATLAAKKASASTGATAKVAALALCFLLSIFCFSAKAQFSPLYTVVNNATNSMPLVHNYAQLNFTVTMQSPSFLVGLTNINTNQTYTLQLGSQEWNITGTNLISPLVISTNFSAANGFTNGGSAYIPIPAEYWTATNTIWGVFGASTVGGGWNVGVGTSGL